MDGMSFLTLRDPETSAKAHKALVMHYPQGGKTSEELRAQNHCERVRMRRAARMVKASCEHCRETFWHPAHTPQRFCSPTCWNQNQRLFEPDAINDIRRRGAMREPLKAIAFRYGVSVAAISKIITGKTYRDVPEAGAA